MNVIFGAGGFAREVAWLLHDLSRSRDSKLALDAFVASDNAPNLGSRIRGVPVLGESAFFELAGGSTVNIFLAVGSPKLRLHLHKTCLSNLTAPQFPSVIHPSVRMDDRPGSIAIGAGSIICAGTILTTDINVGRFVHINLNCTLGHDSVVGDYSTLSPGVHVSGGASLGELSFFGTGAVILENLNVVANAAIGAGATVVSSISELGTYVGTPAKRLQR